MHRILVGLGLVVGAPALAQEAATAGASGYAELIVVGYGGVDGVPVQFVERVRPEFSASFGDRVRLVGTIAAALTQGRDTQTELQRTFEQSPLGPLLDAAGCEWPTDGNEVLDIDDVGDWLAVDRLYVDFYGPKSDVRVGRQALQWGSAQVFHPTDPFPEVLLTQPWANRKGVNAVRATFPFGAYNNAFQAVLGMDDTFRYARVAGRATVNAWSTDFSLVGAYRGEVEEGLVGLDIRGTAVIGFWFEGAVHMRPLGPSELGLGTDAWVEFAVGVDYSFPVGESLIVGAQYYRNGHGDPDGGAAVARLASAVAFPDCADGLIPTPPEPVAPDPFAPFVSKVNYGLLIANVGITQDVSVGVNALHGFDDGTGLLLPTVTVRPTGWLSTTLNVQVPYDLDRGGGEFRPSDDDLVLEPVPGVEVDLAGLVPDLTAILWVRASF